MTGQPSLSPPLAVSTQSTEANRTGTWRFERPEFVDRIAPCNEACPLGQDINSILALQARGEVGAALEKILLENPFPGLCGLGCHAPCERACNRGRFDRPVSIKSLERFAAENLEKRRSEKFADPSGFSVAVLGQGLAALSCAWFLIRLGHRVTLLSDNSGWTGSPELAPVWQRERAGIISAGVIEEKFSLARAGDIGNLAQEYDGVFLEPGLGKEPSPTTVLRSRDFLRLARADQSIIGQRPTLVGFGPLALKVASFLGESGRKPVIVSAGDQPENVDVPPRAKLYWSTEVLGILTGPDRIQGLVCRRENKEFELAADQVILCLGERSDLEFEPPGLSPGAVVISPPTRTWSDPERSLSGLISQGKGVALGLDLGLKRRAIQDISLSSVGMRGALSLEAYLDPDSGRRWQEVVPFEELNPDHFKLGGPTPKTPEKGVLTPNQALGAAGRCFNCGICTHCAKCEEFCPDLSVQIDSDTRTGSFDYDHCKGCGICVEECPRGAIGWLSE